MLLLAVKEKKPSLEKLLGEAAGALVESILLMGLAAGPEVGGTRGLAPGPGGPARSSRISPRSIWWVNCRKTRWDLG